MNYRCSDEDGDEDEQDYKKKAVVMNRECCVEKCNKAKEDYDEGSDDKSSVV